MWLSFRGGPALPSADPQAHPSSGGVFFREEINVDPGLQTARVQVQFSPFARDDRITVSARRDGVLLAQTELSFGDDDVLTKADAMMLRIDMPDAGVVTFEGHSTGHATTTLLRFFSILPGEPDLNWFAFYPMPRMPARLKTMVIGTTAVCNANCSHCPTNKAYSKTQAKGVMSRELFEKIIDGLAEIGFDGAVLFGLYGEPLQDPMFAERVDYVRKALPAANIGLSTNAAVYDRAKHKDALARVDMMAVHIEAMSPEIYATAMKPLKVHRTFPRAEQILADNRGRVHIVSPVHKENLNQVASLRTHWENLGAKETEFVALSNRCGQSPNYDVISLAPTAVGCSSEMVETELIVDWDGTVLTCCQDFHRMSKIGDLSKETVAEALVNADRTRVSELLNQKKWGCLKACAGCRIDSEETVKALVTSRFGEVENISFGPLQFRVKGDGAAEDTGIRVTTRDPWRPVRKLIDRRTPRKTAVIFGPYRRLSPGRYRVRFDLSEVQRDFLWDMRLEVMDASGRVLATSGGTGRVDPENADLDVEIGDFGKLEFRIRLRGIDALFTGVQVEKTAAGDAVPTFTIASRSAAERALSEAVRLTD